MSWVLLFDKVGLIELLRLLLLVSELKLQASKRGILPAFPLFRESAHALADSTHDGRGLLGSLEDIFLGELVVSDRQRGLDDLKVVRFKKEWQSFTDSALANYLVQTVLLEVIFDVKDRDWFREWLLHLHNLRPEHGLLVLLGAVGVVIDAVVIGTLGFLIVPTAAPPEIVAQLALYELHGTDNF